MSPLLTTSSGRRRRSRLAAADLDTATSELAMALVSGSAELDPEAVAQARRVVDKAFERSNLAGDHTVVALAGATGSGKSSLFNALVGSAVATIGARRPTTSQPAAAVWGEVDASALLDWLGVASRHLVGGQPAEQSLGALGALDGLVLLDLPDFDSRELSHRVEAERVLELVDVFVWVTDPQKYADARLHDEFVRLLSQHEAVTLAVLNQSDRLGSASAGTVADDLERLLLADGVRSPVVFTTSTLTGAGVSELRDRIASSVAAQTASRQRLRSDVDGAVELLRSGVADNEPDVTSLSRRELDAALAQAAGVPVVLDAVARDYRREAFAHTGWLFARWTRGFSADPLRRLRLDRAGTRPPIPVEIQGADVRSVLGRSSIPTPTASAVSAVDLATRRFVRAASEPLPVRWQQAVEDAVVHDDGSLADALDQAVVGTSLRARRPVWWLVVNLVQWTLGLVALGGLAWLALLMVLGWLQLPHPQTPSVGIVPLPPIMLIGGVVLGLTLGALSRWWARVGARRRARVIGKRMQESVARLAEARILAPVAEVIERHRSTREHLSRATR